MIHNKIYTIGHSTHSIEYFLELLNTYSINCLVDVRSIAASSYSPQYNKASLSDFLKSNNIEYLHFSKEFGARHNEPMLLDTDGKVDFDKVRNTNDFKLGIQRIKKGVEKGFTIALMCSEAEPFDCHRFSLVSIGLIEEGFIVEHILKDKSIKRNVQLENQLLKRYDKKLPKPSMFEPNVSLNDQLRVAYQLRNKDIAYSPFLTNQVEESI